MDNVLIDFTRKLFSELRIPAHTLTLPFQWDDQFDLGLRKTLVKDPSNILKDTFLDFDNLFGDKVEIIFGEDLFTCCYLILPLNPSQLFLAGPFIF